MTQRPQAQAVGEQTRNQTSDGTRHWARFSGSSLLPELDLEYFFTDTGKELPEVYEFLAILT